MKAAPWTSRAGGDAGLNEDGGEEISRERSTAVSPAPLAPPTATAAPTLCDPMTHICLSSTSACARTRATAATVPTECCSLSCTGDQCEQVSACLADNAACGAGNTGDLLLRRRACPGNTCTPLNANCYTVGKSVSVGGRRRRRRLLLGPVLERQVLHAEASFCTQVNDICFHATECCTGVCNNRRRARPPAPARRSRPPAASTA